MTVIEEIIDFISATNYNDIPTQVRDTGKIALVDVIGCMIAGTQGEASKAMYRF